MFRFERGLCPRNLLLGGGFGRGAKPPSEFSGAWARTSPPGAGSSRSVSEKSGVTITSDRRRPDVPLRARALPAQPTPGGRFRKGGEAPLRVFWRLGSNLTPWRRV